MEAETGAVNDNDDPFKEIMDNDMNDSAVEELEFDLNQLRNTRPDLASKNLDADGIVDSDRDVATKESRSLSVDEIVKDYLS